MGLIGRTVPQINILITSLPVNTLVGLVVMFLSLPLMMWQMEDLLQSTAEMVFSVMKEM
jgi:flagellar biosynthetic protein FliR